jgi:FAD/FMN-containing dehydrogenase
MIYNYQDALIDAREPLDARAEYILKHNLEQRERYARMRTRTQLLIDMGTNSLPLELDVATPRTELLESIKRALAAKDAYRSSMRAADGAFSRMTRGRLR